METATRVLEAVEEGRLKNVQLSSEALHELYYVFSDYVPLTTVYSIDRSRGCFEKPEGKTRVSTGKTGLEESIHAYPLVGTVK